MFKVNNNDTRVSIVNFEYGNARAGIGFAQMSPFVSLFTSITKYRTGNPGNICKKYEMKSLNSGYIPIP